MSAERHARAKAIFLAARARDGAARRALLDARCGDDRALRREVESLLAHDDERTILEAARGAVRPAAEPPSERSRWNPSAWRLGPRGRDARIGLIALLVVVAVGVWTGREVTRSLRGAIAESLITTLDADIEALHQWIEGEKQVADRWASHPDVVEHTRGLLALAEGGDDAREALLATPRLAALRAELAPILESETLRAFGIVTRAGLVLATSSPLVGPEIVGTHLGPEAAAMIGRAFEGETFVRMPYRLGSMAGMGTDLGEIGEHRVMAVLAPIRDEQGRTLAALAFLLEPDQDFTRILSIARLGETGDSYAFNAEGILLSHSRFEDGILAVQGLSDAQAGGTPRVRLLDPGEDPARLGDGLAAQPLTLMARRATAGQDGVDTVGYRDARGVEVVGAWRWLPEHGIGVATEVGKAEAYRPFAAVETAFGALAALLAASVVSLALGAIVLRGLQRQVRRLGQYTLVRPLGEGGMGIVYEARHGMLRRPVALKLIRHEHVSEESLARFEREVQLTSELGHPNTIQVYDYGRTDDGIFYYVMEYVDGVSLAALVRREGALPAARVVHIVRQVCGSLAEAHARGLVHRDIKPGNVMLCRLGGLHDVVKVLDFGLAKEVGGPRDDVSLPGTVAGTPPYIAPETLQDPTRLDARSDLYAVGAVAFELLTGQAVFAEDDGVALLGRMLREPAVRPSTRTTNVIPEALDALVLALLAKDPAQRPATARDVIRALEPLAASNAWTEERARASRAESHGRGS